MSILEDPDFQAFSNKRSEERREQLKNRLIKAMQENKAILDLEMAREKTHDLWLLVSDLERRLECAIVGKVTFENPINTSPYLKQAAQPLIELSQEVLNAIGALK